MKRAVHHQTAESRLRGPRPRASMARCSARRWFDAVAHVGARAMNRSSIAPTVRHGYPFRHAGCTGHAVALTWCARTTIDDLTGTLRPWCAIAA